MSAPRRRLKIASLVVAGVLALGYVGIAAFLYFGQRGMLFFPTQTPASTLESLRADAESLELDVSGAHLSGVLLPGYGKGPRPTILYFGGNAEPVLEHDAGFEPVRAAGWNVALVPYRGFDLSTGEPGAQELRDDALVIFDHLKAHRSVDPQHMVAFGYSMGSGVAVALAEQRPVQGVMLAAPYARLSDLAADAYPWLPVRMLFRHEFDSESLAPKVEASALIFHGDADPVIPIAHGRRLAAAWGGPAEFHAFEGVEHNGMGSRAAASPATLRFLGGLLD